MPWRDASPDAQRPCFADDRAELTYGEFLRRVEVTAAQLRHHGIGPDDVVAVMLPNRVELVLVLFAAWRLGATATPVNPAFTAREAEHQLADSGAALVVTAGPDAPDGGLPAIAVDELDVDRGDVGDLPPPPDATTSHAAVALLIYTSGSTGRPKGVMLTHANLTAMAGQMVRHFELTADDHCLLILPLFHVNAILVSVLSPMSVGARTTVMGRFAAEPFLQLLADARPTYFSAVPTIYALLASLPAEVVPDTGSLRFAICGAAPVTEELLRRSEERFGFVMVEGYGLTEGTCASACNPVRGVRKIGTVGPVLDGQQLRVVDPEGRDVPVGDRGEVVIAGPTVMRGYLGRPEETARTIRDGWLHTGDIGVLDEDGYLRIVDRLKDLIIRGGENLYPKEIEATLAEVDGVLEVAVVGRPDDVLGEVPVAFVVRYPDATVTADELLDHCRTNLTRVKVPAEVHLVDALPKNPVGKIDKPTLRRSFQPASV
ncbi:long-chain fatty acid--CoA ligase [Nitriliruptoraceae bacterium ZYF776]|nr:long-chain fatty acid--CoA ligase [Profundirhabdus halotolerans]